MIINCLYYVYLFLLDRTSKVLQFILIIHFPNFLKYKFEYNRPQPQFKKVISNIVKSCLMISKKTCCDARKL